ncbi:hypothetical protein Ndes2526A_g05699 [Nannochloris sp. 'desiccata']
MLIKTLANYCPCNGNMPIHNFTSLHLLHTFPRVYSRRAAFNNNGGVSGSSNDNTTNITNSFLRNPAIAQREAVRQFYLSTCPEEQLEVIKTSIEYLDPPTSLHMCCHLADLSLKGQLEGDVASQDAVLHAIYNTLSNYLPSLPSQSIGTILWSMASVQQNADSQTLSYTNGSNWKAEAIEKVALLEGNCGKVATYNTKELVNILFSVGALQGPQTPSKAVVIYSTELMEQLAARMDSTPYVKGSLSPSDFTDLVSVCARMFVRKEEEEESVANKSKMVPPAALQLMDLVAGEVRRQLANRASSRAAFLPRELTRFLTSFASLEIKDNANVDGLFDVISGFVVNRIRSKHLNAVTKPDDLAAVLAAYAKQQHRSVSVPELLTTIGAQLRVNAAQMQERYTAEKQRAGVAAETSAHNPVEGSKPLEGGPPDLRCSFPTLLSILESHKDLGFSPDPLTLTALLPGIQRGLGGINPVPAQDVVQLLELFVVFRFNPGPKMLELLVARMEDLSDISRYSQKGCTTATVQAAHALVAALSKTHIPL